ncbi:MAG: pyridoxamine 5'-phosphate oxidase family protein [Patescibacteria group bacterium]
MEDVRKLIEEALEKGYLMSLATVDGAGPWASLVVFIYDKDFNLYWLSLPTRRHSIAIEADPRAAATITSVSKRDDEKIGLQVQGHAERVQNVDPSVVEAYGRRMQKTSIDGQIFAPGQAWYVFRPKKIDLIHQPLFGYDKKFLEL